MLRGEAADGVVLLTDEAVNRIRAFTALKGAVERLQVKMTCLSTGYDLQAARLDLHHLQREWAEACGANFVVRNGRKSKVRLLLNPYCSGEVPDDIGRDLVVLQDIALLLDEVEAIKPSFRGMERLWRGAATEVLRFDALIKWAKDIRDAVEAFPIEGLPPAQLLGHVTWLIDRDITHFQPGGLARKSFEAFQQAFPAMRAAARELGACAGLEEPESIVELRTGWIEELHELTQRWKDNVIKAPQGATWRGAARAAHQAGLAPLVEAVENGSISGETLADAFDYAYARWVAETIVNEDEVLSSFLAEKHEARD
jgi:hypothetical protein